MRVVAGTAGGRRLIAPPGRSTRPTSDRVREAVFAVLGSMHAVEDVSVADLFAGTGALGIEALSRGAASATFVDSDRVAVEMINANLASTGLEATATVVHSSVARWLEHAGHVDLAFVDPPYAFDGWPEVLSALDARLVVLEARAVVAVEEPWRVLKVKQYGGTVVTVATRRSTHS